MILALLIGAAMILGLGANPLEGYKELLKGAFGGTEELAESAAKAMPCCSWGPESASPSGPR